MIKINSVSKKFNRTKLFDKFSYEIEEGSFLCIYGESGCGKSTLLNMIGSLESVDEGNIVIYERDMEYSVTKNQTYIRKNLVSYIFQNFALLNDETVLQNLLFAMQTHKLTKSEKHKMISEKLQHYDLYDKINTHIYELSGGEQQRIALIRAQLKPSTIILADEPTGNLDEKNKWVIIDELKKMNSEGKTVIVVTHDEDFKNVANQVLEL